MKRTGIWTTLIVGLSLLALAASPLVFAGGRDSVNVNVKATSPGMAKYTGKVKSDRSRCRKGRKVKIYHDSDPPFLIGETTTDKDGKYSKKGISPPSGDRVFVVVEAKGDGKRRCKELNDSARVP